MNAGFKQVARIPGAVKSPAVAQCNNPALRILKSAPQPEACNKIGAKVACDGSANTASSGAGSSPQKSAAATGSGGSGSGGAGAAASDGGSGAVGGGGGATAAIDPTTGVPTTAGATDQAAAAAAYSAPVDTADGLAGDQTAVALLALSVLTLLGVVIVPPMINGSWRRKGPG